MSETAGLLVVLHINSAYSVFLTFNIAKIISWTPSTTNNLLYCITWPLWCFYRIRELHGCPNTAHMSNMTGPSDSGSAVLRQDYIVQTYMSSGERRMMERHTSCEHDTHLKMVCMDCVWLYGKLHHLQKEETETVYCCKNRQETFRLAQYTVCKFELKSVVFCRSNKLKYTKRKWARELKRHTLNFAAEIQGIRLEYRDAKLTNWFMCRFNH